jgi:anaphase-promoting complex subunit 2
LLHPGANTADILAQYIAMIKCLQLLDPRGTLLDLVSSPVKDYLK